MWENYHSEETYVIETSWKILVEIREIREK